MESKTFSIDHDLYYAVQYVELDTRVEKMYREIDMLAGEVAPHNSEATFAVSALRAIASEINQTYLNRRMSVETAIDLMRSIWNQAVDTLQRHGYELEMPDDS